MNTKNDGFDLELKQFIITRFETRVLALIAAACDVVTDPRNKGAHRGILSFEEVLKLRPEIVKSLNDVIDVLY